ncbi:MAG TPA: hypothetical protein VGI81_02815, partial [Tepidisphaeraceae bacterium]
ILIALSSLAACGCSSNFDRQWEAAGNPPAGGIEGRWQGHWKSEQDGHTGALRCLVRKLGPETYEASFDATYASVFTFAYDAKLEGRRAGDQIYLLGDQDLGWPVYTYHYAGMASPAQLYCTYHARDDRGFFALVRPGGTPPKAPLQPPATPLPTTTP